MNPEKKIVGSTGPWAAFRFMQAVVTLFVLALVIAILPVAPGVALIAVCFLVFWSLAFAHHLGHAVADDHGITFRRYFRLHFVPWSEVKSVSFRAYYPMVVITLSRWQGRSRWIHLWPPRVPSESLAGEFQQAFGLSIPDVVPWINQRLPANTKER